ncbi:MAG: hypothetical protein R2712_24210 [Vicinamibacterales bacterium]
MVLKAEDPPVAPPRTARSSAPARRADRPRATVERAERDERPGAVAAAPVSNYAKPRSTVALPAPVEPDEIITVDTTPDEPSNGAGRRFGGDGRVYSDKDADVVPPVPLRPLLPTERKPTATRAIRRSR